MPANPWSIYNAAQWNPWKDMSQGGFDYWSEQMRPQQQVGWLSEKAGYGTRGAAADYWKNQADRWSYLQRLYGGYDTSQAYNPEDQGNFYMTRMRQAYMPPNASQDWRRTRDEDLRRLQHAATAATQYGQQVTAASDDDAQRNIAMSVMMNRYAPWMRQNLQDRMEQAYNNWNMMGGAAGGQGTSFLNYLYRQGMIPQYQAQG